MRALYIHTLCHVTFRSDSSKWNIFLPGVIPVGGMYYRTWLCDLLWPMQCEWICCVQAEAFNELA